MHFNRYLPVLLLLLHPRTFQDLSKDIPRDNSSGLQDFPGIGTLKGILSLPIKRTTSGKKEEAHRESSEPEIGDMFQFLVAKIFAVVDRKRFENPGLAHFNGAFDPDVYRGI